MIVIFLSFWLKVSHPMLELPITNINEEYLCTSSELFVVVLTQLKLQHSSVSCVVSEEPWTSFWDSKHTELHYSMTSLINKLFISVLSTSAVCVRNRIDLIVRCCSFMVFSILQSWKQWKRDSLGFWVKWVAWHQQLLCVLQYKCHSGLLHATIMTVKHIKKYLRKFTAPQFVSNVHASYMLKVQGNTICECDMSNLRM